MLHTFALLGSAMGWEWRNGRRYYYAAERVGGRVVKKYVGTGRVAELIAQLNALDADTRKWARIDREVAAARRSRPSQASKLIAAADRVLAVWLPAAGWHRPNRGPWRRKRGVVMGEVVALAERKPLDTWDAEVLWRENGGYFRRLADPPGGPPVTQPLPLPTADAVRARIAQLDTEAGLLRLLLQMPAGR